MDNPDYTNIMALGISLQAQAQPKYYMTFTNSKDYKYTQNTRPNAFNRLMQKLILGIHWGVEGDD